MDRSGVVEHGRAQFALREFPKWNSPECQVRNWLELGCDSRKVACGMYRMLVDSLVGKVLALQTWEPEFNL